MYKIAFASLSLALATSALLPQTRAKDKAPVNFAGSIERAQAAWEAGQWGTCATHLDAALGVVRAKRSEAILAALPAAPEGWSVVAKKLYNDDKPFAAMMSGLVGSSVEHEYKQDEGNGSVKVTLTFDSPAVQMMNMMLGNPAMLGDNKELIEYDQDRAVLETKNGGRQLSLQILISSKHICQVDTRGIDDETLFKIFDQPAVDKLSAAMAN